MVVVYNCLVVFPNYRRGRGGGSDKKASTSFSALEAALANIAAWSSQNSSNSDLICLTESANCLESLSETENTENTEEHWEGEVRALSKDVSGLEFRLKVSQESRMDSSMEANCF